MATQFTKLKASAGRFHTMHNNIFTQKHIKKSLSSEFSELSAWLAKAHEQQTQFAAGSGDLCAHKGCCSSEIDNDNFIQ